MVDISKDGRYLSDFVQIFSVSHRVVSEDRALGVGTESSLLWVASSMLWWLGQHFLPTGSSSSLHPWHCRSHLVAHGGNVCCPPWQLLPTLVFSLPTVAMKIRKKQCWLADHSLVSHLPPSTQEQVEEERERGAFPQLMVFQLFFTSEHRSVLGGSPRGNGRGRGCALLF